MHAFVAVLLARAHTGYCQHVGTIAEKGDALDSGVLLSGCSSAKLRALRGLRPQGSVVPLRTAVTFPSAFTSTAAHDDHASPRPVVVHVAT